MQHYSELAALLSHEFAHINHRHTTKTIFRQLAGYLFISLLVGDVTAIGSVIVSNAQALHNLQYSRALEDEADLEAYYTLTRRQIPPQGITTLFKKLKGHAYIPEVMSTHPDIDKRIAAIDQKITFQKPTVRQHPELIQSFTAIKKSIKQ